VNRRSQPTRAIELQAWGLLLALVAGCGGSAFSADESAGAAGQGGAGSAGAAGGSAGAAAEGGAMSGEAGATLSEAGAISGEAGTAGNNAGRSCEQLSGQSFEQHCYVDITTESLTQPLALTACREFAAEAGRKGSLLVLDSSQEQSFVLVQFMNGLAEVSDAWLALTCSDVLFPDFSSCYCKECADAELIEKQAAWHWVDASTARFGWINGNPNGDGRCAALGYNPSIFTWGWVDRVCGNKIFQSGQAPVHSYRTICELEGSPAD